MTDNLTNQQMQRAKKVLQELTLFDDRFMTRVFAENIPATKILLQIILEEDDLNVITVTVQKELKNPLSDGRNIKLDILAQDSTGRYMNIEIQGNNEGAHFRRARFHSSMLDATMAKEKQAFKAIKDSYVIFITENDVIGEKFPLYHVDRIIRETNKPFDDGSHIIYVNGSYEGDDPIGKLIHDLKCKRAKEMYYKPLADSVSHFKESKEGSESMCKELQEWANEIAAAEEVKTAAEKAKRIAVEEREISTFKKLVIEKSMSPQEALDFMGISEDDKEKFLKTLA